MGQTRIHNFENHTQNFFQNTKVLQLSKAYGLLPLRQAYFSLTMSSAIAGSVISRTSSFGIFTVVLLVVATVDVTAVAVTPPFRGCLSCWSSRECFLANVSNRLTSRWATYGWSERNCPDIFANAAKQFVCKNLSRIFIILYWMVRMTTRIKRPPKDISEMERSVYQVMFLNTCQQIILNGKCSVYRRYKYVQFDERSYWNRRLHLESAVRSKTCRYDVMYCPVRCTKFEESE